MLSHLLIYLGLQACRAGVIPASGSHRTFDLRHCSCLRLSPMLNRGESPPPAILTPQPAMCKEWCAPGMGLLGKMIKAYGWQGEECASEKEVSCHLHRYLRHVVTGLFLGLVTEPRIVKARRIEIRKGNKETLQRGKKMIRARFLEENGLKGESINHIQEKSGQEKTWRYISPGLNHCFMR